MVEAGTKPVIFERTLKDGEKLVVNGIEIEVSRKKRHERQIRVKLKIYPNQIDGIDTAEFVTS